MRTSLDSLSYNAWEVFPRKIKFISSIDKTSVFNIFLVIQQKNIVHLENIVHLVSYFLLTLKYIPSTHQYTYDFSDKFWADQVLYSCSHSSFRRRTVLADKDTSCPDNWVKIDEK
jgi:hypothetical protein